MSLAEENEGGSRSVNFVEYTRDFLDEQIAILSKPVEWNGRIVAGSAMNKETIKAMYEHINMERDLVMTQHFNQIAKASVVEQLTEIQRVRAMDEKERSKEKEELIYVDKEGDLVDQFGDRWPRRENDQDTANTDAMDKYEERVLLYNKNKKLLVHFQDEVNELSDLLSQLDSLDAAPDTEDAQPVLNHMQENLPNIPISQSKWSLAISTLLSLISLSRASSLLVVHSNNLNPYTSLAASLDDSFDTTYTNVNSVSDNIYLYDNILVLSNTLTDSVDDHLLIDQLRSKNVFIVGHDNSFDSLAKQLSLTLDGKRVHDVLGNDVVHPQSPTQHCQLDYSGYAHSHSSNPLLFPQITTPPLTTHSNKHIVSSLQTTKNTRMSWLSSSTFLNDDSMSNECNKATALDILNWTFHKAGVVNVSNITHYKTGESAGSTAEYVYNDEANFELHLSNEHNKPFITDTLQLEFTMLDPHIRTHLPPSHVSEDGTSMVYKHTFRVPDRHGIFKFVVDWKQNGFSFIDEQVRTTVVPVRHDEHPRFLSHAWPFYSGTFTTIALFVVFAVLWLGWDEKDKGKKRE
ncbi:hypothetical protein E3P99_00271 [Wallemia hederae]|uniref:OST48 middle domain-containing protein n=1 Tax=Wallemia hederae TaxID=1540922 RepID=A0A4V4LUX5_9BASI|nr:hypothetical protein E3P99_00271 [Wallemia hederae]